jgi:hypothetical protein
VSHSSNLTFASERGAETHNGHQAFWIFFCVYGLNATINRSNTPLVSFFIATPSVAKKNMKVLKELIFLILTRFIKK